MNKIECGVMLYKVWGRLRVGMKVVLKLSSNEGYILTGTIGEKVNNDMFIFSHDNGFNGIHGQITPQSKGFEYSWVVAKSEHYFVTVKSGNLDYDINWGDVYGLNRG